jgi:integrase/recombinase XerC
VTVVEHETRPELTASDRASMLAQRSALLEQLEQDLRDNNYEETPIGRLVARYLAELRFDNYSPGTVQNREYILSKLALKFAHRTLADLTYDDLRDFLSNWAGAAANTRAVYVSAVKTFVRWAHERDFAPADSAKKLRAPRSEDSRRRAHPRKLVRQLVLAQESRMHRLALLTLYWGALRRSELRAIQWRDIDLEEGTLIVTGKGRRVIEMGLHDELLRTLRRYADDEKPDPTDYLLHYQRRTRRGAWPLYWYSTTSKPWRQLSSSGIDKWWQRCVARAGLDHFPMHEMRHTAGTHFQEEGHDLFATQHFLRHKSVATTERYYLHLDKRAAVNRVHRMIGDVLADEEGA